MMKAKRFWLPFAAFVLVFSLTLCVYANADTASYSSSGISAELITNKDSYSLYEEVVANLVIANGTSSEYRFAVDLTGFEFDHITAPSSFFTLAASKTQAFTWVKDASDIPNPSESEVTEPKTTEPETTEYEVTEPGTGELGGEEVVPDTSDGTRAALVAGMAAAAIVALAMLIYNRKRFVAAMAIVLIVSIVMPMIPPITVKAAENAVAETTIEVSKTISVGEEQHTLHAVVTVECVHTDSTNDFVCDNCGSVIADPTGYYLVWEDFTNPYPNTYSDNIPSSWDAQLPAGGMKYVSTNGIKIAHMVDNSEYAEGILQREFNAVSGTVVWEFTLNASGATDGAVVEMQADDQTAVRFQMEQGALKIGETTVCTVPSDTTLVGIRVVLNTETDTFTVAVDGVTLDTVFAFVDPCDFVNRMYLRTTESNVGTMGLSLVRVYKNLYINEKFLVSTNALPDAWSWNNEGSVAVIQKFGSVAPDVYNLKIADGASISADATYTADEAWLEYQFLISENSQPDLTLVLSDGQENTFRIGAKASGENNQFGYYNSNNEFVALYDLLENQWYHVMVKVTNYGGLIYLNHKLKAEGIELPFSTFDALTFETGSGEALLDDILLKDYCKNNDDYVPEPELPEEDDYIVGMQACSLWKEGSHFGWDWISDWEERQSLLGLYDEMSSECADWEIKWMVEHSVDFEFFCWYRPPNSVDEPIKQPRNAYALEEAYFNAEYSDLLKFAISWENGSGTPVSGSEDFRENIVPYWIEQYFKDNRYMLVDNKPIVGIYNFSDLKTQFGSIENIKAELDYLKQACIDAGFDGCIVMLTSGETSASILQEYADAGIDCLYAYNWGPAISVQQDKMLAQSSADVIDMVPTICMGRDDSAWERTAGSYLTNDEFRTLADWVADEFMPTLDSESLGQKMVMIGNWNEYGEGHYVMPSNLNGFGYLDTIRTVFGDGNETHTDTTPTEAQLERINRMYIQDRVVKRTYTKETSDEIPETVKIGWYFNTDGDSEGWEIEGGVDALTVANGSMSGNSTDTDPKILSLDGLNIAVGDVPYIRVRIKVDPVNTTKKLRMYFTTTSSTAWAQTKCLSVVFTGENNEYVEYLFDTSTKTAWTGTLKQLRIDPLEEAGSFSIDSIELLQTPSDSEVNVLFEGEQIFTTRPVYIRNDHVMFPAAELSNYITASWCTRIDNSALLLYINEKDYISVAYDEALATLNGSAIEVMAGAMQIDGEYYFPLDILENVGYTVAWDKEAGMIDVCAEEGTGVEDDVTAGWPTEEKDMDIPELPEGLEIVKAWYFDHDTGGWDYGGATAMEWKNGVLYLYDTVSNDPIAYSPAGLNIDTQAVSVIRIRVRTDNPSGKLKLYFTTAANEAMNTSKVFKAAYADVTPGSDGYYTFDIDCSQLDTWTGTLERLRITPASTTGKFYIDSVELLGEDNTTYDAGLKILVIGNSITQHDPSTSKGWLADWGMAATCAENDYVHRLLAMAQELDTSVEMQWVNISQFEAYYYDWSKITKDYSAYADFDADIIISTIGANINNAEPEEDGTYDSGQFFTKEHYKAIIDYFNADGEAAVLVGTTIWVNGDVETAIEAAVDEYGYEYVSMNDLTDSKYRATSYKDEMIAAGVVSEDVSSGVMNHPGDEGMRIIANRLWKKLRTMMITEIEAGASPEGPAMDVPALPEGTEVKQGWYFDETTENWVAGSTATAVWENGTVKFGTTDGSGPVLWSAENLNIDLTGVSMVRVRIKVDGDVSGKLKLYFIANGATAIDATNMVYKLAYADVTPGSDGYYTFDIDCTTNANWTGTLTRLRIDPAGNTSATYYVDSVELLGAVAADDEGALDVPDLPEGTEVKQGWYFDETTENWVAGSTATAVWENGTVKFGTTDGSGPVLWSAENLNIDLTGVSMVRVRIKVDGDVSGKLKLYFIANGATAIDATNMVYKLAYADVTPGSDSYYTFDIDCTTNANWTGTLTRLRIDPAGNTSATYHVDSVELLGSAETN